MSRRTYTPPISSRKCEETRPDYKDLERLRRFLSPHGQMLSRKRTGYCTQCQRALKQAIKRARHLSILPFVG